LNPHDRLRSADFKSAVSADFTIRASQSVKSSLTILTHPIQQACDLESERSSTHRQRQSLACEGLLDSRKREKSGRQSRPSTYSACWTKTDRLSFEKILCRASVRPADHGLQPCALLPCYQPQRATGRARQHSPVRVIRLSQLSRLLQQKQRTRLHLLRNPHVKKV
jgi:hypothetical protein